MSKYTTQLRFICEQASGLSESAGLSQVDTIIAKARPVIFNFDYPIYDPAYKATLETKILRHFYTREIGFETVALWKFHLQNELNEIMPYFNQIYKTTLLEFNPLYTVDYHTERDVTYTGDKQNGSSGSSSHTSSGQSGTTQTAESSGSTTNKYSDTPQGGLQNLVDDKYLTNASIDSTTDTTSSTSNGTYSDSDKSETSNNATEKYTNTDDYLEHVYGKSTGDSYAKLIQDYRQTFINIDMQIIESLDSLFMGLW